MKKIIITICFAVSAFVTLTAQEVRFNAYSAYTFDDKFDSYYDAYNYYNGTLKGCMIWGGGLEVLPAPSFGAEVSYQRMVTKAPTNYIGGNFNTNKFSTFDVDMNFIMLGGTRYVRKDPSSVVEGFAGASMGVAWVNAFNPDNNKTSSATKFGWGIKAGVNIWASEKVAVKLQASMLSAVQAAGGGLYFGTGGSGAGLSLYSTIYQWCLGGGLTFKLKGE